ncbi:hypothetical protein P7H25_08740 [Paenibacillus larvae]|nr:hypothetical protein [Paenibacillus larvae]MDT2255707.1 hypothetical protein [Paenibacillus larvae]
MDFARIANIMELPIPKLENLASSVVWLGNNFATTETEIWIFPCGLQVLGVCWIFLPKRSWPLSAHFSSFAFAPRLEAHSIQHDHDQDK